MKKVERINIIMRYVNNRAHFTISEIMREFNISGHMKSTSPLSKEPSVFS